MIYHKCDPVKDAKLYKQYLADNPYCQVCGSTSKLSRHHIIRFKRSDERCNLLVLCLRCHGACHDAVYRDEAGEELPRLTLGVILTVKRLRNPKEYDRQRLEQLFGQTLVDELPLPEFYEREWESRLFKQTKVVKPAVKPVKPQVEAKPRGKLKCRRCIRLNLDIDCGNCRAENE